MDGTFTYNHVKQAEEVGLSSERLERITEYLEEDVRRKFIQGAVVLVIRKGKIALLKGIGYSSLKTNKPMDENTIFRIYSMTKPITSVALLTLYEKGLFKLSDPVSKYLPELGDMRVIAKTDDEKTGFIRYSTVAADKEMTIHNLLCHTSGIGGGVLSCPEIKRLYQKNRIIDYNQTLQEMIEKLGELPLANHPGTVWEYGKSHDVLGRLIEVITGTTLNDFLEQTIFKPLSMYDTGFYVEKSKLGRLADFSGEVCGDTSHLDITRLPNFISGGSGGLSSITDYSRFLTMLYNGGQLGNVRILGRKTIELMTSDHLDSLIGTGPDYIPGPGYGFGFGLGVRVKEGLSEVPGSIGEFNWLGRAATSFFVDKTEEMIGILMTQKLKWARHYQTLFKTLVYQAIVD
ncbi:serine hydrolase domain-containing protein [Wukongibacter sp. M2B1]|uniref:serine hydrolase domain-containing protein n=1 Tax=Wukongibacter sp. M2B1 TaxID=3088895 RepID=UPI003D79084E